MSRVRTLLIAASLAAAPVSALAATPQSQPPAQPQPPPRVQHFEWSMSTDHGRLGIEIIQISPELREHFGATKDRGVLVAHVEPNSAAAKAGIEVGDVIVDVGGKPVARATDVLGALADVKKGQTAYVDVIRDRQPLALRPTLTEDPVPVDAFGGFPGFNDQGVPDQKWFEEMFDHMGRLPGHPPMPMGSMGKT
jgi:membrane-associated protease RseP (regulator of RpoE activity)